MSYCRFTRGVSDLYIINTSYGVIQCLGCPLHGSVSIETRTEMIAHVKEHIEAGHLVPPYVLQRLERELKEYGEYIING